MDQTTVPFTLQMPKGGLGIDDVISMGEGRVRGGGASPPLDGSGEDPSSQRQKVPLLLPPPLPAVVGFAVLDPMNRNGQVWMIDRLM